MTPAEYKELKPGDHVWCFSIYFNETLFGTLGLGLIAELEKREGGDAFNVIQVKKGSSLKAGKIVTIRNWSSPSIPELFKNYNDGVDHWNSVVNNELDRLTSYYEESTKRVKGKLLKKEK